MGSQASAASMVSVIDDDLEACSTVAAAVSTSGDSDEERRDQEKERAVRRRHWRQFEALRIKGSCLEVADRESSSEDVRPFLALRDVAAVPVDSPVWAAAELH